MDFGPNVLLDFVSLATVLMVLHYEFSRKRRDENRPSRFRALLVCVALILTLDMLAWRLNGCAFPGARVVLYAINSVYYALQIVFCWLWVLFTHEWTGRTPFRKAALIVGALPMLAELVILAINPFTGWVFGIDVGNLYRRGAGYLPNLIPYLVYIVSALLLVLYACLTDKEEESRRHNVSLCAYMMLPVFGGVMEAFNYGVPWTWSLTALSLLLVYMSIRERQSSRERVNAARLEVELAESRRAIMLSQIQPHFLYNVLCVIQDLCHEKAPEAEEATVVFSRFLRGNMESLATRGNIPFERELEHTRYYLTLEQKRFGERLRVVYDIRCALFRLPPLTLQPIVENAVRNGTCRREAGGTVTISTRETAESFEIVVQDDGVGFDPAKPRENGRTPIGISNVRERLRAQSNGTLRIESTPGVGTVAVIAIPKEGKVKRPDRPDSG